MRLPCPPDAKEKTHFLTDFYASAKRFNLPLAHFANYSENAYLKFYNEDAVRIKGKHNQTALSSGISLGTLGPYFFRCLASPFSLGNAPGE